MTARLSLLGLLLALSSCDVILRRDDGTQAVAGRYQHNAVWTGKEMLVGGGTGGGGGGGKKCENGACDHWERYDPATDSWRHTLHEISRGRYGQSAVWTGGELLVWGGQEYSGSGNELSTIGLRYSPSTDLWSSISGKGAPSPRLLHSAIWTGSEMIVWGGTTSLQSSAPLGDGGRYDPKTDTWKPISATAAPSARSQHGAVWTGKEMIVWGGQGSGYAADGARYDPATDTWSPVATAGQPDPRGGPGLVWSGKEMIVVGGFKDSADSFSIAAAAYDPSADTWRTLDAPQVVTQGGGMRWYTAAVWIGDGLVIWRHGAGGERYRQAADAWELLFPEGAGVIVPATSLDGMTAVWTGSEVIVWGGGPAAGASGDTPLPRTGLRYNPTTNTWRPTAVVMPDSD